MFVGFPVADSDLLWFCYSVVDDLSVCDFFGVSMPQYVYDF